MSFSKISAVAGAIALASKALAHGTVTGIVADGVYYAGYQANYQYLATQPIVVGWSTPEDQSNGFIAPDAYATSDIICHLGATNAQTSATVAAGGRVELQWTVWPDSHHGPVIDYLANCGGDCKTVDKTTLEFFKIDGVGLIDDTTVPGTWATDQLINNNNTWAVTIPSDIAPGNYVLRHEIIALHSAGTVDGAQNYPQCVNIEVTGSGTASPAGVLGTALYTETDPGIEINIYQSLATYVVPGPTLYSGAESAAETGVPSATASAASSAGIVTPVASSTSVAITSEVSSVIPTTLAAVTASTGFPSQYSNSTATSTKKSKSACKSKTKTASLPTLATSSIAVAAASTSPVLSSAAPQTTSASIVTIATTSGGVIVPSATRTVSSPSSVPTSSEEITEPSGTTLGDILAWLSSFYTKHAGTEYTSSTVARRHPRALLV